MRKLGMIVLWNCTVYVSVPLRGLDMRKPTQMIMVQAVVFRFSPLAGIRYAETFLNFELVE